jgi:hypothetical protein
MCSGQQQGAARILDLSDSGCSRDADIGVSKETRSPAHTSHFIDQLLGIC